MKNENKNIEYTCDMTRHDKTHKKSPEINCQFHIPTESGDSHAALN